MVLRKASGSKQSDQLILYEYKPNIVRWVDGKPVGDGYTAWAGAGPDGGEEKNCAAMNKEGMWIDANCTTAMSFVCMKQRGRRSGKRN